MSALENLCKSPIRLFKHSKTGVVYELLGRAIHTETEEALVLYRQHNSSKTRVWARPKAMFFDTVTLNGETVNRFMEVTNDTSVE